MSRNTEEEGGHSSDEIRRRKDRFDVECDLFNTRRCFLSLYLALAVPTASHAETINARPVLKDT